MTTLTLEPGFLDSVQDTPVTVTTDSHVDFATLTRLTSQLDAIPSDEYQTWVRVGMALKNESDQLYEIWNAWSATSLKYDPSSTRAKWESFDPTGDVTLGSVYYLAEQHRQSNVSHDDVFEFDDFMDLDFDQPFLIDDILVEGEACLVYGASKSLKTSLMLCMAIALACGGEFLGRACKLSKVLFLSGESGYRTLQKNARAMVDSTGSRPEPGHFRISKQLFPFAGPLDVLERWLDEFETDVLMVDPAYLCVDGTEANNMMKIGEQLKRVDTVCQDRGVTFVLAHHVTKTAAKIGHVPNLNDAAWSGFNQFARQWIGIGRMSEYVEKTGQHHLQLHVGGSADHGDRYDVKIKNLDEFGNRVWELDCKTVREVKAETNEDQYDEDTKTILDALADTPDGVTKTFVRDELKLHRRAQPTLLYLEQEGLIESIESGKTTRYRLPTQA